MSLSKKIAVSFYNGRPDPYKKTEFPSLQEICQKVIEQNFHIYPELDGIDPFFKEQVSPFPNEILHASLSAF